MFELEEPDLLSYDEDEERRQLAALSALASSSPKLDPSSQFEELDPVRSQLNFEPVQPPPSSTPVYDFALDAPEMPDTAPATAALAAAAKPPAPVTPAAAPAPVKQDLPATQDPLSALMQRGEEQRQRQLEAYGEEEPSVNGWALLADVVFNRGKSIPNLLQQVSADKRAWREGRQKILTGSGSDPVNQAIAFGNLQARMNTGERLAGKDALAVEQDTNARNAFMSAYGRYLSPEEQEAFANAPASAWRTMAAEIRNRVKLDPETQKKAALGQELNAAARAHGANVANANDGQLLTIASDARGEGTYGAQARHLGTRPQTPDQIAADKLERAKFEEAKRARAEATAVRKAAAEEKAANTRTSQVTKYSNDTEKARASARILDELEDVIATAKAEHRMPAGLGAEAVLDDITKFPLDQDTRGWIGALAGGETADFQNAAIENQKLLQRLGESLYRIDTGASGNAREEMKAAIANATKKSATLPEIEAALRTVRGILQTDIGGGLAVTDPELAGQTLIGGGIKDPKRWISSYRGTQPQAAAPATDPTLTPGQSVVVNAEGDEVVEGAGAGAGGYDLPPEELVEPGLAAQPEALTLGKTPGLPPLTPEQEQAKKRWGKYRRAQ